MSEARIAYALHAAEAHDFPQHPEHAGRVPAIRDALNEAGLLGAMRRLDHGPADRRALLRCHSEAYLEGLAAAVKRGPGLIDPAPTYVTPRSFDEALLSAGGAIAVVDALLSGSADHALSLCRPPGHHALRDGAMGFCLLANISIAARYAQASGIERVLILDWDVHHGNGTAAIFEQDPSLLLICLHQQGSYPGTGALEEIGLGPGRGSTINLPLPAGSGDAAFALAFERIVIPAVLRFEPQLCLVSAGFDAHARDPLADLQLTASGYHRMTSELVDLAARLDCPGLGLVLEGGYDLPALGEGVVNVVSALRGEAPRETTSAGLRPEPMERVEALIEAARKLHAL